MMGGRMEGEEGRKEWGRKNGRGKGIMGGEEEGKEGMRDEVGRRFEGNRLGRMEWEEREKEEGRRVGREKEGRENDT